MFIRIKKHKAIVDALYKEISILECEIEDKEYFCNMGKKAAQAHVNGYAMVDKSFLPKQKNCYLFMGHGSQLAADKLKMSNKKYGRAFIHENRVYMNELRWKIKQLGVK